MGFVSYYISVLVGAALGRRQTHGPLSPKWRYRHWKHVERFRS